MVQFVFHFWGCFPKMGKREILYAWILLYYLSTYFSPIIVFKSGIETF